MNNQENQEKYDLFSLPGMGPIDNSKKEILEEKSVETSVKKLKPPSFNPQLSIMGNRMKDIVRRKAMVNYFVKLNKETQNNALFNYNNSLPDIQDRYSDFSSPPNNYQNNSSSIENEINYERNWDSHEILNNEPISINNIVPDHSLDTRNRGNSRFIRANLTSNIMKEDFYRKETRQNEENLKKIENYQLLNKKSSFDVSRVNNNQNYHPFMRKRAYHNDLQNNLPRSQNIDLFIKERGYALLETFRNIKDKAKNDILRLMLDGEWHKEKDLIRLAKKTRYIGQVSFGIMMHGLKEIISDQFILKEVRETGDSYFKVNDKFIGLLRAAYLNLRNK